MIPRDIFLLAARILGLVFLYRGLDALPPTMFVVNAARPAGPRWAESS